MLGLYIPKVGLRIEGAGRNVFALCLGWQNFMFKGFVGHSA